MPRLILVAVGLARLSTEAQRLLEVAWPIGLVLIGLALLAGGLGVGRRV